MLQHRNWRKAVVQWGLTAVCAASVAIALWISPADRLAPAFAGDKEPKEPTEQEQQIFAAKLQRLKNDKAEWPHPVDGVVKSLDETVTVAIPCPAGTKYKQVEIRIRTKLNNWEEDKAKIHKDDPNAAAGYLWLPQTAEISKDRTKKTVTFENSVALDPAVADAQEKTDLGKLDDERLLYHEFLHGQLLIDHMKNNKDWQKKVCNSTLEYEAMDKGHKTIPGLEQKFLQAIAKKGGWTVFVTEVKEKTTAKVVTWPVMVPEDKESVTFSFVSLPADNVESASLIEKDGKLYVEVKLKDPSKPTVVVAYIDPPQIGFIVRLFINTPENVSDVVAGPVPVPLPEGGASAINAGRYFTCALTSEGGVVCWGRNSFGQLGNGSTVDSSVPVDVSGLTNGAVAVSAGDYHACAVKTGGSVVCWGRNHAGQLGNGTTTNSSVPVTVSGLAGVSGVSAGAFHTCAVTAAGAAWCWGQGGLGQLGNGSAASSSVPVAVSGLSSGAAVVSAGYSHSCALTTGGAVQCWGNNALGQLGNGATAQSLTPVGVSGLNSGVVALAAGDYHNCVVTSGDGGIAAAARAIADGGGPDLTLLDLGVAAGGGVKCWGDNSAGQVGDNSQTNRLAPVDVVGLGSGVSAVSAGRYVTCALTSDGGAQCWGDNTLGQLGNGSTVPSLVPVDVTALSGSAGALSAGSYHVCALTGSTVHCWGARQ